MTRTTAIRSLIQVLALGLTIAALIWPAMDNGYPLVYSDSGSYIASGHLRTVPIDRPIAYGLFVDFFSFNLSLWSVIVAQAFLVFLVVYVLAKQLVSKAIYWTALVLILLSFTTGLSNYTSQIMADVFSGIGMIGFVAFVVFKLNGWQKYVILAVTVFSLMTHFSNVLVCLILSVLLFFSHLFIQRNLKMFTRAVMVSSLPIVFTLFLNFALTSEAFISNTSSIFIVGRLAETGVLTDFLTDKCPEKGYIFCDQIESIPKKGFQFLWFDDSPLYDEDCRSREWTSCWLEKNHACGWILKGLVQSPKHLLQLIGVYASDFSKQIADFDLGVLDPQREGSSVQDWIKIKFPNELDSYTTSEQYKETLRFERISLIQKIIVYLSFLGLLLFVFKSIYKAKVFQNQFPHVVMLCIGFLLANAMVVVVFSTVLDRYQSRLIWVVPFLLCLIGAKLFEDSGILKTN